MKTSVALLLALCATLTSAQLSADKTFFKGNKVYKTTYKYAANAKKKIIALIEQDELTNVETFDGDLTFQDTQALKDFKDVFPSLNCHRIHDLNTGVETLEDLSIEYVGGRVRIVDCNSLKKVDWNLKSADGRIRIDHNENLDSVIFPELMDVGDSFEVYVNDKLQTIECPKLTAVKGENGVECA